MFGIYSQKYELNNRTPRPVVIRESNKEGEEII